MKAFRIFLLASAGLVSASAAVAQEPVKVVATIKPVYSLLSSITEGTDTETSLLVKGAASPHTYNMTPSDARALQNANVVFWVGPALEHFMEKPLSALSSDAEVVALEDARGVETLAPREGGTFEAHDHDHEHGEHHDDHDHAHDEHAHEEHDEHAHEDAAHAEDEHHHVEEHEHDEAHHHHDGEVDPHMWLDPENAKAFADAMAETLAAADPDNASVYLENASKLDARLDGLTTQIKGQLADIDTKPYIVFHDAYHYYGNRFGVEASGSITVNPEAPPSAARIREIQDKIQELNVACVFSEPQFPPKVINAVIEGTDTRVGTLDPIGAGLEDGSDLYFQILENLTGNLTDCFAAD